MCQAKKFVEDVKGLELLPIMDIVRCEPDWYYFNYQESKGKSNALTIVFGDDSTAYFDNNGNIRYKAGNGPTQQWHTC